MSEGVPLRRPALPVDWEALLAAEGMPAEPVPVAAEYTTPVAAIRGKRLRDLARCVRWRQEDAAAYYGLATDYLWGCPWRDFPAVHRQVWERHCEGSARRETAAVLRIDANKVQAIVDFHRGRAGMGRSERLRELRKHYRWAR